MAIPLISTSRITIILNLVQDNNNDDGKDDKERKKMCGFHLTRSKWDPYPWIEYVEHGSIADVAGLKTGDCLLQIDQVDIVGLRVKEIALLIKEQSETMINLQIWRSSDDDDNNNETGAALSGPLPILIRKFIKAVSTIVSILECPVCLETAASPVSQCVHGHILCAPCRIKTLRCPVCRVRLGQGRCLIADEIQRNIKEAFDDDDDDGRNIADNDNDTQSNNKSLKKKLFGKISLKSYGNIESSNTSTSSRKNFTDIPQVNHMKKKYKIPFSRLLRVGGFDRAISADNLMTGFENPTKRQDKFHLNRVLCQLTQADRTKSASTGELCQDKRIMMNGNDANILSSSSKTNQHLSVPMTLSSWGGSMESIYNYNLFLCPLFMQSYCREPLSQDRLAEHLGYVHNYKNQMHIYGNKTTIKNISSSLLFESLPIYIFHYADELFIFQYENETAWMIGTGVNAMKWILYARTQNKTEFKLQRQVLIINDTIHHQFSSQQAKLSNNLSIDLIHIELIPLQSDLLL